jgi:hypothetical protein
MALAGVPPPKEHDHHRGDEYDRQIEAPDGAHQQRPMPPKQISGAGDHGDPTRRSQQIEDSKGSPGHAEYAGERPREHAHADDETGKENRGGSVARKHSFATSQGALRYAKDVLVAIEQGASAMAADGISQVVADGGGASGHDDDPTQMKLVFRVGEKAREQERGLARYWDSSVLAQQRKSNGPISVVGDEGAERVDDGVVHERGDEV